MLFRSSVEIVAMAARRSLGGGRVLGPAPPPKPVAAIRSPAILSPSESSVSLSSQTSSTPISTENEDLTSRIALDEQGTAQAAAAASSRMVCPICNEEMVGMHIRKQGALDTQLILNPGHTLTVEQVGTRREGSLEFVVFV